MGLGCETDRALSVECDHKMCCCDERAPSVFEPNAATYWFHRNVKIHLKCFY